MLICKRPITCGNLYFCDPGSPPGYATLSSIKQSSILTSWILSTLAYWRLNNFTCLFLNWLIKRSFVNSIYSLNNNHQYSSLHNYHKIKIPTVISPGFCPTLIVFSSVLVLQSQWQRLYRPTWASDCLLNCFGVLDRCLPHRSPRNIRRVQHCEQHLKCKWYCNT